MTATRIERRLVAPRSRVYHALHDPDMRGEMTVTYTLAALVETDA